MPQNGIQHEGIAALAEAFKSNSNLKVCNQQLSLMIIKIIIKCRTSVV